MFCKIVNGEAPSFKIWENDGFLAILDKYPRIEGQLLVIKKEHSASGFLEMDSESAIEFVKLGKFLAGMMKTAIGCFEVTFLIEGLDVKHAHVKLFPVNTYDEYVEKIGKIGKPASDNDLKIILNKYGKGE